VHTKCEVNLYCLKNLWMSEVLFVKEKQIAESSRDQVQQSTTDIRNNVQAYQLPNDVFLWKICGIDVWRKEILISIIQHYIHLMQASVIPPDTCSTYVKHTVIKRINQGSNNNR